MKIPFMSGTSHVKSSELPEDPYAHSRYFGNNLKNAQDLMASLTKLDSLQKELALRHLYEEHGKELKMFLEAIQQSTKIDFSKEDKSERARTMEYNGHYSISADTNLDLKNGYNVRITIHESGGRSDKHSGTGPDDSLSMELAPGYDVYLEPSYPYIKGHITDSREQTPSSSDEPTQSRTISFNYLELKKQDDDVTAESLAALMEMRDVLRGYFVERSIGKITDTAKQHTMKCLGVRLSTDERE